MTSLVYQGGNFAPSDLEYSYDGAARRVGVSGSLASTQLPAAVASAVYNADNQLTQWGSATMSYDLNGNTLSDGTNSYTWDARNRLVSADNNGATFAYDALGRRMSKTVQSANTSFLYDGVNPVQELNGTTPTANLLTGGIDERFTRTDANGTLNYITDALGSTVALADTSGNSQVQYSYDPYGNMDATGSTTNSYTYTGREFDGIGLYYYRARYYDPSTGRFLSEDPMGFISGGPNLYGYVQNSPTNLIDPSGLWQITITVGLGYGGRFTIGNNGGGPGLSGLINGQWNIGLYGGVAEGASVDADVYDRGCRVRGTNWGVEGAGELGFGPLLQGEAHVGTSSWGNLNFGFPGTPLGWSVGTEGATVPTFGAGESAFFGIGGTHYF